MGISVGGNRGIFVEMNVVPLIDVLLVLLVIFMIIPHKQSGMKADLPQPASPQGRMRATERAAGKGVRSRAVLLRGRKFLDQITGYRAALVKPSACRRLDRFRRHAAHARRP